MYHSIINKGLNIVYRDEFLGNSYIRLNLKRISNRNYLVVGGLDYKIHNTNKLITLSTLNTRGRGMPNLTDVYEMFSNEFGMGDVVVTKLFKDGYDNYKNALKKSEELLNETMTLLKVNKIDSEEHGKGYVVKGVSGKEYFVKESDLHIFSYPGFEHICIIDKGIDNVVGYDKLVGRLYALANDERVAKDIHTLKKFVGKQP